MKISIGKTVKSGHVVYSFMMLWDEFWIRKQKRNS